MGYENGTDRLQKEHPLTVKKNRKQTWNRRTEKGQSGKSTTVLSPTNIPKFIDDYLINAGFKQPPKQTAEEKEAVRKRLEPVGSFRLGLTTPQQIDRYFNKKLEDEFNQENEEALRERWEQYQRHGGKNSFEQFKDNPFDNTEKVVVNNREITVWKDHKALVAAGAPTPLEQRAITPRDKYDIIKDRLGEEREAIDFVKEHAPHKGVTATFTVFSYVNEMQQGIVDEQAVQLGFIDNKDAKHVHDVAIDVTKDKAVKPFFEPVVEAICDKYLKVPQSACKVISEEVTDKAAEEAADRLKEHLNNQP